MALRLLRVEIESNFAFRVSPIAPRGQSISCFAPPFPNQAQNQGYNEDISELKIALST